jgi:hypothetical protein
MRSKTAKGWSKLSKKAKAEALSVAPPGGFASTAAIQKHAKGLPKKLAAELKDFADKNSQNF